MHADTPLSHIQTNPLSLYRSTPTESKRAYKSIVSRKMRPSSNKSLWYTLREPVILPPRYPLGPAEPQNQLAILASTI